MRVRARTGRRRIALAALLAVSALLAAWAFWFEPASCRVRVHELAPPGWPQELSGLRVALLADFHVGGPGNGLDKLGRAVAQTNAAAPDLILLGGDYVIHGVFGGSFVEPREIAAVLAGLSAPLGVFAVLGNHDWWLGARKVQACLEEAGIPVLENRCVEIARNGASFWLAGISDLWESPISLEQALRVIPAGGPILVLTHNPDVFPEMPARVSLTLAGHTHGGQVRIPGLGRLIVPSRYGQRYAALHVVEDGRHLFVTPGLGTSVLPLRFLVPPEISLLELRGEAPQ
ncbi:MAG: metallophosphoesterase [Planctomycetes bacterium]|nr:metallophosphoesterase [Planctomycetota bacterium]